MPKKETEPTAEGEQKKPMPVDEFAQKMVDSLNKQVIEDEKKRAKKELEKRGDATIQ